MPNACWFDGYVAKDPVEVPIDPSKGKKPVRYCYFTVGHNRLRRFPVNWIPVVCYGERCRIVMDDLKLVKGDYVIVQGELMSRYETKDGKKNTSLQVRLEKAHRVLASKSDADSQYEDEPDQRERISGHDSIV